MAKKSNKEQNAYWQHKTSEDVYAVQLDGDTVVSACGPLHYSEVTAANLNPWDFNNDPELVESLNASREEYQVASPRE